MSEDEYHLILPSNSSSIFYPENAPANFTTKLRYPLALEGDWEVALVDIQYPHNWNTIDNKQSLMILVQPHDDSYNSFFEYISDQSSNNSISPAAHQAFKYYVGRYEEKAELEKSFQLTITLPKAFYNGPSDVCKTLNSEIDRIFQSIQYSTENQSTVHNFLNEFNLKFDYNPIMKFARAIQKGFKEVYLVCLGRTTIPDVLGLIFHGHYQGCVQFYSLKEFRKFQGGIKQLASMYIYSDIVKYQTVGDTEAPLLGVLPLQGQHNKQNFWSFNPLHYIPVNKSNTNTIHIKICTDTGDEFPFQKSGQVVCRLHFRRKRLIF